DAILQDRYAQLGAQKQTTQPPDALWDLNVQIQQTQDEIVARRQASVAAGAMLPLSRLAGVFNLSELESNVLILCAAAEVNLHFEILFSYAQNDVTKKRPTVDLIMRLFCEGRAENLRCRFLFSSDSPLFRHSLIRFVEE